MSASIVAVAQPANNPPRVQLTISGATAPAIIQRIDSDGSQVPVRGGEPVTLVSGAAVIYDEEIPFGNTAQYQIVTSGAVAASSAVITLNTTQAWLIDPAFPSLSTKIYNVMLGDDTLPEGTVLYPIPGRADAIPVGDGHRKTPQSSFTCVTKDVNGTAAMDAILASTDVLLLQVVYPFTGESVWLYISVGPVTRARVTRRLGDTRRKYTVNYTVVSRPSGSVQAQWTYADVFADYASYQVVKNGYLTYRGLLTGVEGT